ncbi:MAG: hypothetical protein Kow001_18620 [Acidobacteriota bacterium]
MNEHDKQWEKRLDEAIEATRSEKLEPAEVAEIADRVGRVLGVGAGASGPLRTCDDFQALVPEFLAGTLSEARTLLFEAHTRECLPCRRALTAARTRSVATPVPPARVRRPWMQWGAIAAGLVLAALLFQYLASQGILPGFSGEAATLQSIRGPVFAVKGDALVPLSAGGAVENRQVLRTGKGGGAVLRLPDGSVVELAERTEAVLVDGWRGITLDLHRGNLIVEAAPQGSGRLAVETADVQVEVKGTVFSVSHGMKGSRVSVLEGQVWVAHAGHRVVLEPGSQYASQPALARVSLQEDYAWSQEAARHLAALNELSGLTRKLQQATFGDHWRYSSELVGELPADTVVYAALPNLSGQLEPALQAFKDRIESSPTLSEWFAEGERDLARLDEAVSKLSAAGRTLGDEVVLALVAVGGDMEQVQPVVVAPVLDAAGLRAFVEEEAARINAEHEAGPVIVLVEDPAEVPANEERLLVWISESRLVATPSGALLRQIATGAGGSLTDSAFYTTIAASYEDGVDWLLAMDLERFSSRQAEAEEPRELLEILGVEQVKTLVIQRRQAQGVTENRAVLSFEGEAKGLMQWVGQPGPMGGLDYVSRDAHLAAAFVINDPGGLVDQLLQRLAARDPEAAQRLRDFELEHGVDIRRDIAGPLGGEVVFALDGPMLPTPAWKLVVEVYDPATLQRTVEWAVAEINQAAAQAGEPGVSLTARDTGGSATWELHSERSGFSVFYRYAEGYLIVTPDPALIDHALQYRQTGYSLSASSQFAALLPRDPRVNLSGLLYENVAPLVAPLVSSGLGPAEGAENLQNLQDTPPMLAAMYAEPGRITISGVGDLDTLWLNLAALKALAPRPAGESEVSGH